MATARQRAAAKHNIKKATGAAQRGRSIEHAEQSPAETDRAHQT
jgi:hypothetical protein